MFVQFNYKDFPLVHVIFGKLNSTNEFNQFINEWLRLYEQKNPFTFIFDTTNLEVLNIKYSFKMSAFIYRLKKEPIQYLEKSIIIVKNNFIQYLLDLIFFIQSPVAPVYIIKDEINVKRILNNENVEECKIIYP
uniref:CRAL-TRIO domain-containing protein n=1 Tax=viral metagenome TaxID=1070528 RepID=A0A6C0C5S6_9ZZZZ